MSGVLHGRVRVQRERGDVVVDPLLGTDARLTDLSWGKARERIERIAQNIGLSSDFAKALEGAEFPKLAREYLELWIYFKTRTHPGPRRGADPNPFRGLTGEQARRKFRRLIEDICDRSVRWLGPWR